MRGIEQALRDRARAEGFDAVGICSPGDIPEAADRLYRFLAERRHGEMSWMERKADWRGNPRSLWPEARSVIMLAHSYCPQSDPLDSLEKRGKGTISVYARNRDYHDVVKGKLKAVGRWLVCNLPGVQIKVFVDTAPVMEKPLAEAAGLGWQGKHTNLVSRKLGSWFFLGAIFTTARLEKDRHHDDLCGSCRRCLDACPTNAFPAPYQLDARRCISYLTIEHKGPVDEGLRGLLGNRIFGCDDCLAVCPWNKFAVMARETRYHGRKELEAPDLGALAKLDDAEFRERFRGGPIKRIGRNRLVRNVLYALGNSGEREAIDVVRPLVSDPDPAVSDAAAWAEHRLEANARVPGNRQEA